MARTRETGYGSVALLIAAKRTYLDLGFSPNPACNSLGLPAVACAGLDMYTLLEFAR